MTYKKEMTKSKYKAKMRNFWDDIWYYNVSIEFDSPELAVENFSGYLDLRSSAMQVLLMIAEIVDVEVIQSDRIIKIRKK